MKNKKIDISIIFLIGIILFSSYVYAFAVSTAYWKENPLIVYPGETKEVYSTLQNIGETEDINIRAEIRQGEDIAELIDSSNIYLVPANGKTRVNFRVTMPADRQIGEKYNIKLAFTTVANAVKGTFGIGSAIEQNIDIFVGEKVEAPVPKDSFLMFLVFS